MASRRLPRRCRVPRRSLIKSVGPVRISRLEWRGAAVQRSVRDCYEKGRARVLAAFANAFRTPDLRKKIFFTLAILAVFRLGSTMPTPNVNVKQVSFCLKQATTGDQQGLYSLINLFSDGALLHLAVFALGIMPYITASIILQLLTVVIPRLEALKKEGSSGQTKITQYTRYLTLVLAVLNSTAFVTLAVNDQLFTGCTGIVYKPDSVFAIAVMILTMTAGTSVIMWMGELITERGV